MKMIVLVGIGGFVGSVLRFIISSALAKHSIFLFPLGTLLVNIIGSFLIGILLYPTFLKPGSLWFYFLVPGLLGGFTTYSAFSGEVFTLFRHQNIWPVIVYTSLTLMGGVVATGAGYFFSKILLR